MTSLQPRTERPCGSACGRGSTRPQHGKSADNCTASREEIDIPSGGGPRSLQPRLVLPIRVIRRIPGATRAASANYAASSNVLSAFSSRNRWSSLTGIILTFPLRTILTYGCTLCLNVVSPIPRDSAASVGVKASRGTSRRSGLDPASAWRVDASLDLDSAVNSSLVKAIGLGPNWLRNYQGRKASRPGSAVLHPAVLTGPGPEDDRKPVSDQLGLPVARVDSGNPDSAELRTERDVDRDSDRIPGTAPWILWEVPPM